MEGFGSSPLARGTFANLRLERIGCRLIPARAGNILNIAGPNLNKAAHPRSRGEHPNHERDKKLTLGSSPLARGTSAAARRRNHPSRLIPARAGNIRSARAVNHGQPAHPRSRGEHSAASRTVARHAGSSPLARGTFAARSLRRERGRLIPARAGNIRSRRLVIRWSPAHPRSRGEHRAVVARTTGMAGSSPLARGTSRICRDRQGVGRLIPARAGNIHRHRCPMWVGPAHPRSRGEHFLNHSGSSKANGSSPLARGTYPREVNDEHSPRLIPARAGNIYSRLGTEPRLPAHPRSRGEHKPLSRSLLLSFGSSPLARGTCCTQAGVSRLGRLIPARAGNIRYRLRRARSAAAHPRSRGEHAC